MIFTKIRSFLASNLWQGLRTSPFNIPLISLLPFPVFAFLALCIGFYAGNFHFKVLNSSIGFLLPFTLFVFPSLLEEMLFRGLLIPNNAIEHGTGHILFYLVTSTLFFVLWHPLNALTVNPAAIPLFFNPFFLLIAALLALACGISYILSRSLWIPVIIHWLTVLVWVFFLGGRNRVLEMWS